MTHRPSTAGNAAGSPSGVANADPTQLFATAQKLRVEGRNPEAEGILRDLLRRYPDQPALMHELGLVAKGLGNADEAEGLFRKVIAAAPREPAAHNNLGNILRAKGRYTEAEGCFRAALAHKPDYAEALYNLGITFELAGRDDDALTAHNQAASLQPYPKASMRIGAILIDRDEYDKALFQLDKAIEHEPDYFDAHYYRGWALAKLGRFDEALDALHRAAEIRPGSTEALFAIANALRDSDRTDEALDAYWKAIEAEPAHVEFHEELNKTAWMTGRTDMLFRSYQYARERIGDNPDLLFNEAAFRLRREAKEHAEMLLRRALELAPERADIAGLLGRALARQGKFDESYETFAKAIAANPSLLLARHDFGFALLSGGQPREALKIFEAALAYNPDEQMTLAGISLAYRELGDSRYHDLVDPEKLVRVYDIDVPRGYADARAFNAALAEELAKLHTTKVEPPDQTLRGGTQTPGQLFEIKRPILEELRESIAAAVARYIREFPNDPNHPLFRRRQDQFSFSGSWSCRLRSSGFHTNHVHPMGWISSAYYVHVPDDVADENKRLGWLKFGESDLKVGESDRPHGFVKPAVGKLALFPSYFWHGTVPFAADDYRMTVAFDAVPGIVDPLSPAKNPY